MIGHVSPKSFGCYPLLQTMSMKIHSSISKFSDWFSFLLPKKISIEQNIFVFLRLLLMEGFNVFSL